MNLEARRRRILQEVQRGLADVDAAEADGRRTIDNARVMRRVLTRTQDQLNKVELGTGSVMTPIENSRKIAGKQAVEKVATVLDQIGRTTQAEITRATALNSGTVSHALRVLEADGRARKTGRRHHRSDEWTVIAPAKAAKAAKQSQAA